MLSAILSKSDCASCRFCCSFRRQSLWETPLFEKSLAEKLSAKFKDARFKPVGKNSCTIDLSSCYKTDNSEEEATCPFLDANKGCLLTPEEKPFDCSIWPLRASRRPSDGKLVVALTRTCPTVNKVPLSQVEELVKGGLGEKILSRAKENPDMIKDWCEKFVCVTL